MLVVLLVTFVMVKNEDTVKSTLNIKHTPSDSDSSISLPFGTVSRDFLLQVFFMNHLPQAPDNNIGIISNFFENSRRYSQVKVHQRCQRHRWQICHHSQWHRWQIAPVINVTGVKFATGINDTGGKFCHQFLLCCWHRWQICHRCQRYRRQIIGTISGCRQLKVNLKAKLLKFFLLKIFSICHWCRWHRWQTLSCEYLREFSKKFATVLMEYSGAGGKLIHGKNQKHKISWHCPFKESFRYEVSNEN